LTVRHGLTGRPDRGISAGVTLASTAPVAPAAPSLVRRRLRTVSLFVLALFYVAAGVRHFTNPGFYLSIVPPVLPFPLAIVYVSGVVEIALGALVLVPRVRRLAAWCLIALLVAVFPANLYMWWANVPFDGQPVSPIFHAIRLPFQAVFIAWAYWHTRP
jgi:uncharacterized membrane protein